MHIFTMLFLLSILVLAHELGHFGVARMLKINVEKFGFGLPFGPTLYETKWGKTKILVHAFLLGGYVAFPDDDPESTLPKDDPGRISNRKVWERFLVIIAGVTANVIIAYLIVLLVAVFSGGVPSGKYNVFIEGIQPDKTLSVHHTGIKPKDKIISVNGTFIDSPYKFIELAQRSKKFDGYVAYTRINEQITSILKANPELDKKLKKNKIIPAGYTVKLPASTPEGVLVISKKELNKENYVPEGQKLNSSQIKLRNSLDNKKFYLADGKTSITDLAVATGDTVHPVNITVEREGKPVALSSAYPNKDGIIGVKLRSEEINIPAKGPVSAITGSWTFLYRNTVSMLDGLVKLVTGKVHFSDLHGIVAITKIGSDIIQKRGIWDGLLLTSLISMDLAIVNLLPIPALDGGHLLFLFIEKLMGHPVKEETQEAFAKFGFMFLMGLMLLIVLNDFWALFTNKL